MNPEKLSQGIKQLLEYSVSSNVLKADVLNSDNSEIHDALVIANPSAGGFKRAALAAQGDALLDKLIAGIPPVLPAKPLELAVRTRLTEASGDAMSIAREYCEAHPSGIHPIFAAGGDGTSREVLSAISALPGSDRRRFPILRLPMGTGNDGADGRTITACLGRLCGPSSIKPMPGIVISSKKPFSIIDGPLHNDSNQIGKVWAFNIASLGIDAFVAHNTNRIKAAIPGDFYRFFVDIAAVFYELLWKPSVMSVFIDGTKKEEARRLEKKILLLAVGASGHRQYGANKAILPGDENVCLLSACSLVRKLLIKGPLQAGRHEKIPELEHYHASALKIEYDRPILMQCDGDILLLEKEHFPLDIQVIPGAYWNIQAR